MTLPNAYKGVKKLFIAEILQLIAVVLVLIGLVMFGAMRGAYIADGRTVTAGVSGLAIGSLVSMLGAVLLPIIAIILSLVGLKQASKDEPDRMAKAFAWGIAALIISVLAGIAQSFGWGGRGFLNFLISICEIVMIVYSIMGVSEVTQNIARQDVADLGPKILTISVIAIAIAAIAGLVGSFIGGIAATISLILMLITYFIYVVFLGKATSALAKG